MCGIIGYIGRRQALPLLMEGLRRLEYRGYDSAGIAVLNGGALQLRRSVGKIARLEALVGEAPPRGVVGLGHSRWATHGRPSEENAHPHTDCTKTLVVIHNGIIENYLPLKRRLLAEGHVFESETDTEVVSHLIEEKLKLLASAAADSRGDGEAEALFEAVRRALGELHGAYALAILWARAPGVLIAAKTASPLVIGFGEGETFLASDVPAFLEHTREAIFLEDGELAVLEPDKRSFFRLDGGGVEKTPTRVLWDQKMAEKAGYRHFMLKEIHEQPQAVEDTLRGRLFPLQGDMLEREAGLSPEALRGIGRIYLVACGTAHYAAVVGKYLIERSVRIRAEAETAAEFRYREPLLGPDALVIAISQSGETADTLAAVKLARESGAKVLSICNVLGSAIPRACDHNFYIHCGPEFGVASTKAFVGQLTALQLFALHASLVLGRVEESAARAWAQEMLRLPGLIRSALKLDARILELAKNFYKKDHFLYIGRHFNYPIALEGALKLKEISYIHAEGYAAGEMKHGPIALIDEDMPVVAIATESRVFDKMLSNIEEARARGAILIAVANEGDARVAGRVDHLLEVPRVGEPLSPIVNVVPLQLLAYHIADLRGCDVDQPRNLAKSVTVE